MLLKGLPFLFLINEAKKKKKQTGERIIRKLRQRNILKQKELLNVCVNERKTE